MFLSMRYLTVLGCLVIATGLSWLWLDYHTEYDPLKPVAIALGTVVALVVAIFWVTATSRNRGVELEKARSGAQEAEKDALAACADVAKLGKSDSGLTEVQPKVEEAIFVALLEQWGMVLELRDEVLDRRKAHMQDPFADPNRHQSCTQYAEIQHSCEELRAMAQSVSERYSAFFQRVRFLKTVINRAPDDCKNLQIRHEAMGRRIDTLEQADYRVGHDEEMAEFGAVLVLIQSFIDNGYLDEVVILIELASISFDNVEQTLSNLESARSDLLSRYEALVARRTALSERSNRASRTLSKLHEVFKASCLLEASGLTAAMRRSLACSEALLAAAVTAMSMQEQDWSRARDTLDRVESSLDGMADLCERFDQQADKVQALPGKVTEALEAAFRRVADIEVELGSFYGDNRTNLDELEKLTGQLNRLRILASAKRPHYKAITPAIAEVNSEAEDIRRRAKSAHDRIAKGNREDATVDVT